MFVDLLKQGGPVLWVILGSGVLAFGVFIERALHLHRARIKSEDFLKGIMNILSRRNITEALTICDETPGPVAYIVKTAILHRDQSREDMRAAVEDASLAEISRMERRLVVVATVAQVAPLLGLLGTVLGMMESLLVLQSQAPLIQSADLMGGLIRALMTTAAGLTVAVPCYASFNLLVVKIDRVVLDMEKAASEIIPFLLAGTPDEADRAT
ncbi:MAG: MotA/TolQ/ExbB proton channel family protein [Lentisphaerae bacterium]|nr:MotA/TolQ/ExbB proton channel family protein [Lentisphaerota bacterium]